MSSFFSSKTATIQSSFDIPKRKAFSYLKLEKRKEIRLVQAFCTSPGKSISEDYVKTVPNILLHEKETQFDDTTVM